MQSHRIIYLKNALNCGSNGSFASRSNAEKEKNEDDGKLEHCVYAMWRRDKDNNWEEMKSKMCKLKNFAVENRSTTKRDLFLFRFESFTISSTELLLYRNPTRNMSMCIRDNEQMNESLSAANSLRSILRRHIENGNNMNNSVWMKCRYIRSVSLSLSLPWFALAHITKHNELKPIYIVERRVSCVIIATITISTLASPFVAVNTGNKPDFMSAARLCAQQCNAFKCDFIIF